MLEFDLSAMCFFRDIRTPNNGGLMTSIAHSGLETYVDCIFDIFSHLFVKIMKFKQSNLKKSIV